MIETYLLFVAIFILEVILEIDNITALRRAAEGLPNTPMCRGQVPHAIALGVRVTLTYMLFHAVALFSRISSNGGQGFVEQIGGMFIIMMALGLVFNYMRGGKGRKTNVSRRIAPKKTDLITFLIADAFLSLDTVIAAVAMTTNFNLAVTAMISAAVCIMLFHKSLQAWLKLNPRMALIAFIVIGLLGVNLILAAHEILIPKYYLLFVVCFGIWLDHADKQAKQRGAELRAQAKVMASGGPSQARGSASHLVETINKISDYTAPTPEKASPRLVVPKVVVPRTIESSWAEVVQKSENVRDILQAEQDKSGGAYDYTPEGKKIAAVPTANPEAAMTMQYSLNQEGYVFGTTHSAGVAPGRYGFIFLGATTNPFCKACGIEQPKIFSLCDKCGYYRFLCPAGIFEVGSLRLLTKRA